MKDQINTIRKALTFYSVLDADAKEALAALTQLEAMVGEPVADINVRPSESGGTIASVFSHKLPVGSWLLYRAAPVAQQHETVTNDEQARAYMDARLWEFIDMAGMWPKAKPDPRIWAHVMVYAPPPQQPQYEAGDVASAAAQGFRDGVASVTQQEPVAWAMPKGDGTFIDVITPAEHARDEGSYTVPLFAHPVAQQPRQCGLCGSDEAFTGACGGGKNNPRALCYEPVDQQPQAEPDDEILKERDDAEDFIDMLLDEVLGTDRPEWTSAYGRDDALRDVQERMTALHKPMVDKAWERFEKAQQPQAEKRCQYCDGSGDVHSIDGQWRGECHCQKQPQAEAVLVVDRVYEAAKRLVDHADFQLGGVLSAKSKTRDIPSNAASKVKARHLASLRDALAKTPQQAEAVPRTHVLVPKRMTRAMERVTEEEGWAWADLLAAAESITEAEYGEIQMDDAAPQQAEAVPPDVVRDAERWRTFLATRPANTHAVINDAIDDAMAKGEKS